MIIYVKQKVPYPPPSVGLPAGYVALEYLDGSQGYVTTDISLLSNDTLYIDFSFSNAPSRSPVPSDNFSVTNSPLVFVSSYFYEFAYADVVVFALSHNAANYNTIAVGFYDTAGKFQYSSASSIFLRKSVLYRFSNVYNVVEKSSVTGVSTTTTTDFLRWTYRYYNDWVGETVTGSVKCPFLRLYQFASYSVLGDLTHNLLPCTNPSGVSGLYDTVDAVFYPVGG